MQQQQQRQRQPASLQSGRLQQEQLTLPGSLAADQSQRLSSSSRKHKKRRRSSSSSEDDSSSSDSSSSGSSGSDSDSSRDRSRRRRGSRRSSSRDRKERRGRKSSSKDKVRQGCVIPGHLYCETAPASGLRSALTTYADAFAQHGDANQCGGHAASACSCPNQRNLHRQPAAGLLPHHQAQTPCRRVVLGSW